MCFYNEWKERYIRNDCNATQYFVWFEKTRAVNNVSEGQGYGMIITTMRVVIRRRKQSMMAFRYVQSSNKEHKHLMSRAQEKVVKM